MADVVTGKPYTLGIYNEIRGSAFLFDDWKPTHVTDKDGIIFLNVPVRFDAYANKFLFNHRDTAYEFITVVKEFELFPSRGDTTTKMVFKKGFAADDKLTADKWVQVLAEGKITVIKYIRKTQQEISEYNVPGKINVFADNMTYFFIKNGTTVSQRPSPKFLQELLSDRWTLMDAFMKQHALSLRIEDNYLKAINYYNSL